MPRKKEEKFSKKDFHYFGRYQTPLLYFYICFPTISRSLKKYPKILPWNGGVYLDGHMFLPKKTWESVKQQTIDAFSGRDDSFLEDFYKLSREATNQVSSLSKKLLKTQNPSIKLINDFFEAVNFMQYPWYYSLAMGEGLEIVLKRLIKFNKLKPETVQSFYILEKPTPTIKQQREIVEIKKGVSSKLFKRISRVKTSKALEIIKKDDPILYKKINQHVKRYCWLGMMHFWGEPFSEENCIEQLLLVKNKRNREIYLTKEQRLLKKHAADISFWRQTYADTCAIASYSSQKVLGAEGFKKSGLNYEQLMWFSPPEFISLLKGKLKPNVPVLNERAVRYGLLQIGKHRKIITNKQLKKFLDKFIGKTKATSKLKGFSANKGRVRGKVKIVLTPADAKKFKKGFVMISHETTPDFMSAIIKSKAIVTDIGGVASHAAIVSRELDIPCIVGTKEATRVLKDNDLIEVNANKGVVKKINK